ncbi:cell division protein FtsL [Pseudooceanicola sp. C21-150M6]|uniref:cell division protein FtsL n=1 Tax=Pseudooceanicola sp. C21-150M6 TaxID=3434355 RepID=UPI003D7F8275
MKALLYVLSFAALIGLGFWAYQENYETKQVIDETERLQHDIGQARARLAALRAEWAYLNRPDRLRELAELTFDSLQLLPLSPDQFGRADQVAYPAPEAEVFDLSNSIEVSTMNAPDAEETYP